MELRNYANSEHTACIDSEGAISYRDLFLKVDQIKENLKDLPTLHFGFYAYNGRDFLSTLIASFELGFTSIPLNPFQTQEEEFSLVQDLSIDLILDKRDNTIKKLNEITSNKEGSRFIRPTSGTTGRQKGVVVNFKDALIRAENTANALGVTEDTKIIWCIPMCFHFLATLLGFVKKGATIICVRSPLADEIFDAAERHHAELAFIAPQTALFLNCLPGEKRFTTLKRVISTSGHLAPSVGRAFQKRFGFPITQAYGAIEVGIPIIDLANENLESVGKPIPGYEVKLSAQNELMIKGEGFFSGYLNPELPREKLLDDGWFYTGDIANFDEKRNIKIVGRKKNLIISGGNKIFPEEVEQELTSITGISELRVFGEDHELYGERVIAEIVGEFDKSALKVELTKRLVPFKIPVEFRSVAKLDKTQTGKIKRY